MQKEPSTASRKVSMNPRASVQAKSERSPRTGKSRQRLTLGIVEVVRAEDLDCLWVDKLVSDGDVQHGFSTTIGLRDGS